MTQRVVVFGTAVMTTMLALVVLWQFRIVVVYVLISLAVAATARPFVRGWSRRSLATRLALIVLYLVSLGALGYLFFVVGRFAIGAIQQAAQTLSAQGNWRLPLWLEGSSFQRLLVAWLPTPAKLLEALTGEQGQRVLPAVLGFTEGIGSAVSGAFIILFLSLYWSINQVHFERLWLSLIPSELRMHTRDVWRTIELDVGAYIRSEVAQSLLAGLLLGLGYWLLGSPYAALLALIGALAWLIPVVGPALAVVIVLLMGLLTSVQLSLFTALYTLVILIALQVWVEPRFLKGRLDNPILTLVIVLAMADAFGLIGIIVAPPVSAVCQILWNHLVSNSNISHPVASVSDLKERQAHLWAAIREMDEPPPPLVSSSMERLTDLLEKAEPILQSALPAEVFDLADPVQPLASEDGSTPSPRI